jgi:hypothetical protein
VRSGDRQSLITFQIRSSAIFARKIRIVWEGHRIRIMTTVPATTSRKKLASWLTAAREVGCAALVLVDGFTFEDPPSPPEATVPRRRSGEGSPPSTHADA